MQGRVKKFHRCITYFISIFIISSPFILYAMYRYIQYQPSNKSDRSSFFESAELGTSLSHYEGDILNTDKNGYQIFNFFPYSELSFRLYPCSELKIQEIRYQKKAKFAFIALTLKGKHFCPSKPKLVINKEEDFVFTLSDSPVK